MLKHASNRPNELQDKKQSFEGIIGKSELIQSVLEHLEQVASSDTSVLILGESGTGKEQIAHCIHALSPRKSKPLIKVNCAALPANLIESELFGHEKGAFTGAMDRRIGKFEQASGGTIMLDEIGEMPLDMQVKLLRVLQEKEIERSILLTKGEVINEIQLPIVAQKNAAEISEESQIKTIDENERDHILAVLKKCNGKIWGYGGAAELLGVPPTTLNSKMKKLGIKRGAFE